MTTSETITVDLVRALVAAEFPAWSDLPVAPVARQGWDNRTFRVGEHLAARLPSADGYVEGFAREERTLEVLRDRVSFSIPRVVATRPATPAFSRPWSIRAWLVGDTLDAVDTPQRGIAIAGVADALTELAACSTDDGPLAGRASAYRGCHVSAVGDEVQRSLADMPSSSRRSLGRLWHHATRTVWSTPPAWVHGDVSPGNMLFNETGRFVALIDFGQSGIGDPACDLGFAWLSCDGAERQIMQERIDATADTWLRGAAWALWKTLISSDEDMLAKYGRPRSRVLRELAELS